MAGRLGNKIHQISFFRLPQCDGNYTDHRVFDSHDLMITTLSTEPFFSDAVRSQKKKERFSTSHWIHKKGANYTSDTHHPSAFTLRVTSLLAFRFASLLASPSPVLCTVGHGTPESTWRVSKDLRRRRQARHLLPCSSYKQIQELRATRSSMCKKKKNKAFKNNLTLMSSATGRFLSVIQ